MANNCFYNMKISGDYDKALDFAERLMDMGRVYSADVYEDSKEEGYVRASGDCAWSMNTALRPLGTNAFGGKEESTFLDEARRLGLSIEAYSEELGFGFNEHMLVVDGELALFEETDYYEIDPDDMDADELAEQAEEFGMTVDEMFNCMEDDYIRIGGYDWVFDGKPAEPKHGRESRRELFGQIAMLGDSDMLKDAERSSLHKLSILDCGESEIEEDTHDAEIDAICETIDSSMEDGNAVYLAAVSGAEGLPFVGYELLDGTETIDSFIEQRIDIHSGADWEVAKHDGSAFELAAVCHGHPRADGLSDTRVALRQLTESEAEKLLGAAEEVDDASEHEWQQLLQGKFNDPECIQWIDQTAELIESRCETARKTVVEELTAGIDDFKELSEKGEPVSEKEFSQIFEGNDVGRTGNALDSKRNEAQKAVDALSGKVADRRSPTLDEKIPEVEEAGKAVNDDPR